MNGGLVRLREVYDSLNPSERKVDLHFAGTGRDDTDVGRGSCSPKRFQSGAIVRLCKTMGFKGYQDLKLKVAGDLQEPLATGYQDIRPNDSISAIIQNVSNNNIQSIRDTMKIMEEGKVEEAVLALDQKRILCSG